MITTEDILWAYQLYFQRNPSGEVVQNLTSNLSNVRQLVEFITNSLEYRNMIKSVQKNPFWHYHTSFDAIGIIQKYANRSILPSREHFTNFLGVKIRPEFFPNILNNKCNLVEKLPIPANWHADIAEWASCLRAVDLAKDKFTMLELGCGWGCWMNNLGIAAKSVGKTIKLYGVEADSCHINFAKNALADNQIMANEYVLVQGIAGRNGGIALFPKIHGGVNWGGQALFNLDSNLLKNKLESGRYVKIPIVDIERLLINEDILDFLHLDIQGAELDVLTELFDWICKKVRYIFIGTHSKQIEAGLFNLFINSSNIFALEMERPAFFKLINGQPVIKVDGVQAYRNKVFD